MIPRTIFEPEHEQFRDSVAKFLQAEAVPYYEQWEKNGMVDREFWRKAGQEGFLCPDVPEEYGGCGADIRYNAVITEELYAQGVAGLVLFLHSDIIVPYITKHGTEEQKQKYLPGCVSGEIVTSLGITEPGIGSDVQGMKTTAVLDGDEYVINGSKTFITNACVSDLIVLACKTDTSAGAKGISLFLVDTNTPGFKRGKLLEKIGLKAQDTSELFFEDMRVPKENLLGGVEGRGFSHLMHGLAQERALGGVGLVAGAATALRNTVEYVKERQAFGQPIAAFQNTQFKLAQMDAEISSMQVFIDRCLELQLEGKLDNVEAAKIKLLAGELYCRVVDECLQLHGGYGYMWEYPIARAYADARISRIYGGSSEIMKLIISRKLLKD